MRHLRPQAAEQVHSCLFDAAARWLADDPDPLTRAALDDLVKRARAESDRNAADAPDPGPAMALLADCFAGPLEFGTAGLRATMGPGPNRMNRAVVIRAAAGLTAYLKERTHRPTVVVGYDARHGSTEFALDTCAVVTAAGGSALLLPGALPTPVLAFAIRRVGADAGVMVTASHNPPQDNGYKVYLGDGTQIVPPADSLIRAKILAINATADVGRAQDGWTVLGESLVEEYLAAVTGLLAPRGPRAVNLVHTALHGVGGALITRAFRAAGFQAPVAVPEQAEPDPDFPTVTFPNPEEPGAMDAALDLARRLDVAAADKAGDAGDHPPGLVDAVIVNDPDADRCAAAVPDPAVAGPDDPRGWRMLRGDELGALLAVHLLDRGVRDGGVLARSIVSSRMLAAIASAAGLTSVETLTGFKWIARAPNLAYGYEEALGYCVAPDLVRDKDGISAALMFAELLAGLKRDGRTVTQVLDELYRRHGVHATDAFSVRVTDLSLIASVMSRLREHPPAGVGDVDVVSWDDLAAGSEALPPTDALRYFLRDDTRVIVRPSGTEPKLKVYLEAIVPVSGGEQALAGAKAEAARRLAAARAGFAALTSP